MCANNSISVGSDQLYPARVRVIGIQSHQVDGVAVFVEGDLRPGLLVWGGEQYELSFKAKIWQITTISIILFIILVLCVIIIIIKVMIIITLSSLVGAIVGITLIALRRNESSQAIPFGPYLAVAGWLTLMYGEAIQQAYLAWVL